MAEDEGNGPPLEVKVEVGEDLEGDDVIKEEPCGDGDVKIFSRCLICCEVMTEGNDKDGEIAQLPGSEGCDNFNQQLWSVFVVRNLLKYPAKKTAKLLKSTWGISPADWFSLCSECSKTVGEVLGIYMKLLKLAEVFKRFQKDVKSKIQQSFLIEKEISDDAILDTTTTAFDVCKEIREFFKDNDACTRKISSRAKPVKANQNDESALHSSCDGDDLPNTVGAEPLDGVVEFDDNCGDQSIDESDPLYIPPTSRDLNPTGNKQRSKRKRKKILTTPTVQKMVKMKSIGVDQQIEVNDETNNSDDDEDWPLVNESDDDEIIESNPSKSVSETSPKKAHTAIESVQTYVCHVCGLKCKSKQGRILHLRKTHKVAALNDIDKCQENGMYKCPDCPAQYVQRHKFIRHRVLHRRDGDYLSFTCEICQFVAVSSAALRKHCYQEHNIKPKLHNVQCDLCQKWFFSQAFLSSHKKQEHSAHGDKESDKQSNSKSRDQGRRFPCNLCLRERLFGSLSSLRDHTRWHRISKHPCPKCNYPCQNGPALEIHVNKSLCNRQYEYSCDLCDFKTDRRFIFEGHKQKHKCEVSSEQLPTDSDIICNQKGKVEYKCSSCDFVTDKRLDLAEHKKTAHSADEIKKSKANSSNIYFCDLCPFQSIHKQKIENHIERHKVFKKCEKLDDGKWKCTLCNIIFNGHLSCGRHMRTAHGSELGLRSFKCSICDKYYACKYNLDSHIAEVHTKQCNFFCEICGFGTMKQSTLEVHKKVHSDKMFVCELCASSYKGPEALKEHTNVVHGNTGNQEKYKCKYCPNDETFFITRNLLIEHMKTVHKDLYNIHKFDKCDNSYASVASLQLHQKIHHAASTRVECEFCQVKVVNKFCLSSHYKFCEKKKLSRAKCK